MIPGERKLAAKLADQPFTFLGINSDASRSALKKALSDNNITWPNIFDGPAGHGPVANKWNVHSWPTIYILDREGKVRYRHVREKDLEADVMELLKK
jgi:hypothetical protein